MVSLGLHPKLMLLLLSSSTLLVMELHQYSRYVEILHYHLMLLNLVVVISLQWVEHQRQYLLLWVLMVFIDSSLILTLQEQETLLDLEVLRNSLVLQNLLLGIHLRDNFYSLLMELEQRSIQNLMLVLEELENFQVLLSLFVGVLNIQQVFIESVVILPMHTQETLLDLEEFQYSLVLLNLSPSIQLREICSSPSLVVSPVRSIQNLMLVLEDLETLLNLKLRNRHLIMLVLVQLISYRENQIVMSYQNLLTSHLMLTFLEVNILILVILISMMNIPTLVMLNSSGLFVKKDTKNIQKHITMVHVLME